MKALPGRLRSRAGLTILEVLIAVLALAIIGFVIYLTHHDKSSSTKAAKKPQSASVTFDTPSSERIGPNCSYPTPLGCFIPTASQQKTLDKISGQGYDMAHIEGKGYSDYEMVPGTVPKAPKQKLKALHVTDITVAKGTGQKQQ